MPWHIVISKTEALTLEIDIPNEVWIQLSHWLYHDIWHMIHHDIYISVININTYTINCYFMIHMGVSLNGGTPKWMVYNGKPQIKRTSWGNPPFKETPIYEYQYLPSFATQPEGFHSRRPKLPKVVEYWKTSADPMSFASKNEVPWDFTCFFKFGCCCCWLLLLLLLLLLVGLVWNIHFSPTYIVSYFVLYMSYCQVLWCTLAQVMDHFGDA